MTMLASLNLEHQQRFTVSSTESHEEPNRSGSETVSASVCPRTGLYDRLSDALRTSSLSERSDMEQSLHSDNGYIHHADFTKNGDGCSNRSTRLQSADSSLVRCASNPQQSNLFGRCIASNDTNSDDEVAFLIRRRLELKRTLGRLNNELLKLLYEEWTLTGHLPEGYEQLLQETGRKMQPIKTTSYPLPRLLVRRASTLTRPLRDYSDQSTTSSLISSFVPWSTESIHHDGADSAQSVAQDVPGDERIWSDLQVTQTATYCKSSAPMNVILPSLNGTCSDEELGYTAIDQQRRDTHLQVNCDDPVRSEVSCHSANENELRDAAPSDHAVELSWTEDEEDIRRTACELQLRRLEVDYAVVSQLHAVHKQRAMETKREAYRVAYKSNARKLKEITAQMEHIKTQLLASTSTQSPVAEREPKSSWHRRRTWNPLRIPTPQWSMGTLPRRQGRYESPDNTSAQILDAYSTPVTPDHRFKVPFDSPHKPPPSLASGTTSPAASRASSLVSDEASMRGVSSERSSTYRAKRPHHHRPSLMPFIHFFRNPVKPNQHTLTGDRAAPCPHPPAHPQLLPPPAVRCSRLRDSLGGKKRISRNQPTPVSCDLIGSGRVEEAASDRTICERIPHRSSLFFPRQQHTRSTCFSLDEAVPRFGSAISSLRSSVYGPSSDARTYSACSSHGNSSLEAASNPDRLHPNGTHAEPKLRRSLSNDNRPCDKEDPLRDSAIDLPDLVFDNTHRNSRRTYPSHCHSSPDLTFVASVGRLTCCRRGKHGCYTLERERHWITRQRVFNGPQPLPNSSNAIDHNKLTISPTSATSCSTSSFPPSSRVTNLTRCGEKHLETTGVLKQATSHTSSASNWSTSGCSCLSSQTAGSVTSTNPVKERQPSFFVNTQPDKTHPNEDLCIEDGGENVRPAIRLRKLEARGRRIKDSSNSTDTDAYGSAIRVKCICSCVSEHLASTVSAQASRRSSIDGLVDPTPVGSVEELDRPGLRYTRRQCIHSTDSCETTVQLSSIHTTSSSPSSSALDLRATNIMQKEKSKTTCGVFHSGSENLEHSSSSSSVALSKGSSNRRSIRPLALLRRAVSKVKKAPPSEINPSPSAFDRSKRTTGPTILPALVTSRQLSATEASGSDSTSIHESQFNCTSLSVAPASLGQPVYSKARFFWSGKLRHSTRCPR